MSIVSPELAERLLAEHPGEARVAWEPNPCWYCSGKIINGEHAPYRMRRGTGKDPRDPEKECPECVGRYEEKSAWGYGPQGLALLAQDYEILMSGVKGFGKTSVATVWMVSGNPHAPLHDAKGNLIPVNLSYGFHPDYRGLIVRRDLIDMEKWLSFAEPFYAATEPKWRRAGNKFICDATGATLFFGHLHDASSYMHVQGIPQLHKLWIDEVAQISHEGLYEQLYSCLRSIHSQLRRQIMLSCNWIGPGVGWVRDRFLDTYDYKGEPAKPFRSCTRIIKTEGRQTYRSRLYIFGGLKDNPKMESDYEATLADLKDPKQRKAYYEGDPYAFSGVFFEIFRKNGPQPDEPENADHVIPKVDPGDKDEKHQKRARRSWIPGHKIGRDGWPELSPYWPRVIGGDWGFAHDSAFYWICLNPETKQVHVYREFVVNRTSARGIGVRLAELCSRELEYLPGNAITLYFSPDAVDTRLAVGSSLQSYAQLVAAGIADVLGPEAVWIPEDELRALEANRDNIMPGMTGEYEDFKKQFLAQQRKGITIIRANNDRVLGWSHMRELMLWENPLGRQNVEFNFDTYVAILHEKSYEDAQRYAGLFQRNDGVFPRLQIWECCPKLIEILPKLVHQDDTKKGSNAEDVSKEHVPGLDCADGVRYGLVGLHGQSYTPRFEERRATNMEALRARYPNASTEDLIRADQIFAAREGGDAGQVIHVGRTSGELHRAQRKAWRKQIQ